MYLPQYFAPPPPPSQPQPTPSRALNLEPDLAECYRILGDLQKHTAAAPFNQPVDPMLLNIPDYFDVIKNPMDLGTIMANLEAGDYMSAEEVAEDVSLVWRNCRTYNPPGHPVVKMAETLEHYWIKKYQRSFNRPPPSSAPLYSANPVLSTPTTSTTNVAQQTPQTPQQQQQQTTIQPTPPPPPHHKSHNHHLRSCHPLSWSPKRSTS